jgi:hypothetical protein
LQMQTIDPPYAVQAADPACHALDHADAGARPDSLCRQAPQAWLENAAELCG